MTIGLTLRRLRESANLTQGEIGKRMPTKITKQRISTIESSDDLQFSTVVAYLAAVGYEIQIIHSQIPGDGGKSEIMYTHTKEQLQSLEQLNESSYEQKCIDFQDRIKIAHGLDRDHVLGCMAQAGKDFLNQKKAIWEAKEALRTK